MQGKEQDISVCNRTMLNKLLAAVGASSITKFNEIECGDEQVKVSIQIELSMDGQKKDVVAEGGPFAKRAQAEESAIAVAIKLLEHEGLMRVLLAAE